MKYLSSPDQFVLVCVVVMMVFFFIRGIISRLISSLADKRQAYDDYLFAAKELSKRDIRESTAATYSAFATVFFWFIALGGIYGWLLLLIPIFLYIGNHFFVNQVKKQGLQLGKFSTISSFIRSNSTYKLLHYHADWIVVVFIFSALFVEIVIGSGILATMIPNAPGGQLFFIILISVLVIAYVTVGGFRVVILSDTLQLYVTFAGVIALIIFSFFYMKPPTNEVNLLYFPAISFSSFLAFIVSVISVQMLGPICQLQNWQRISSSQNQEDALKAHKQGALIGAILWSLMIVSALVLYAKFEGVAVNFESIFSTMKSSGIFASYALLPILFIGFIAAMISTADSAMAALYLFFYDGLKRKKQRKEEQFIPTFYHNILTGFGFFIVIMLVYLLNKTKLQDLTITVIYFLFNQLIVVFPIIFYFIIENKIRKNEKANKEIIKIHKCIEKNLTLALFVGWICVLLMSGAGYFSGKLNWTMFASASGVTVASIITLYSWRRLMKIRRILKKKEVTLQ